MLDALLDEARRRWGLDPALGLQVVPAERLASVPIEPSRPLILVPLRDLGAGSAGDAGVREQAPPAADGAALPGRHGHPAEGPAVLSRLYPPDHTVGRFGEGEPTTVGGLVPADLAEPLFLGPLAPELAVASPWGLPWIADRLRRPDGCPWDREQTHRSLAKHLLEEAYEVYDALDAGATPALAGELGDLLLQVVLHAQLAADAGVFDLTDVQAAIGRKIVRRHPHVFGDAVARTASDVNRQWEQIKRAEREEAAALADETGLDGGEVRSALDGISRTMPALAASQEMQERAASLGYDWPSIDGVVAKLHEELGELQAAGSAEERREEVGDLLLVAVNLARREGVEAEAALRAANEKFRRRFRSVERQAAERGVQLRDLDFDQLDELWMAAKAEETSR